jgi:hypothetical protein
MAKLLSVEEIKNGLRNHKVSAVAKDTGLSEITLYSLAKGERQNYFLDTLQKVSKYIHTSRRKKL